MTSSAGAPARVVELVVLGGPERARTRYLALITKPVGRAQGAHDAERLLPQRPLSGEGDVPGKSGTHLHRFPSLPYEEGSKEDSVAEEQVASSYSRQRVGGDHQCAADLIGR